MKAAVSFATTLLGITLTLPAAGQGRGGAPIALEREPYFPLEAGNRWTYQVSGPGSVKNVVVEATAAPPATSPLEVGWVVLKEYFPGPPRTVRRLPGDVVVEKGESSRRDLLWYSLRVPNLSWRLELAGSLEQDAVLTCLNGARLAVAETDGVVRVPAGEFRRVVKVRWQSQCADAGILAEWFAPGVGLVRRELASIAGPVIWELLEANVAQRPIPAYRYGVELRLEHPRVTVNRMPGPNPPQPPTLRGVLTVVNLSTDPVSLVFSGCPSLVAVVRDETGKDVLRTRVEGSGCCTCAVLAPVAVRGIWGLPFSLRLARPDGSPLANGRYSVEAYFETVGPEELRPGARAGMEVHSVY